MFRFLFYSGCGRRCLHIGPTLVAFALAVAAAPVYSAFTHVQPAVDKQSLQYIVWQTTDKTCGPAALATVLTHYFHETISEKQLYELALEAMLGPDFKHLPLPVITLRGLIGALSAVGYTGHPLQMNLAGIQAYFTQHETPIVLQIHHPTSHFTVLLGVVDDTYVLADPSQGHIVMTADELQQHWSGYALLIEAPPERPFNTPLRSRHLDEVAARVFMLHRVMVWL